MLRTMDAASRARVRCVRLDVLETTDRPGGRRLQLLAAVVSPRGPVQGVPLLYLHGGPGGSAVSAYGWFLDERMGPRPVVLLDQRASGESRPQLCPELREPDLALMVRGLDADAEMAARLPLYRKCRDKLRRDGATSEHLRRALGIGSVGPAGGLLWHPRGARL